MAVVLVTGAAGFIGRDLTRVLAERGHTVHGLGRTATGTGTIAADVLDPPQYADRLQDVDTIVHLAGRTGKASRKQYFHDNVEGTIALLSAAEQAGVARFIFVSSIAAGYTDKTRCWYAQSKELAERVVRSSAIPSVVVRPTQVFGSASAPFGALRRLARMSTVPAFGGARTLMQPVFVSDLAEMLADILDDTTAADEILELGGPQQVSTRDLIDRLRRLERGAPARFIDIPITPLVAAVTLLESISIHATPFTVGQLAAFRHDGTAKPNPLWERRRPTLVGLDEMIRRSL